ncbi:substrate-binding domain-containing protein [Streptomyces rubrogriseus]|uniref:substrate-binding domain-containing protein n=1 Tax=Streptomyces rubrogriseus TaxID=194673 RepID=UPI003702AB12
MRQGDVLKALGARAVDQWGLVTAAQAKLDGAQGVQLLRLERAGLLRSVGHGVYLVSGAALPEHLGVKVAWLRLAPKASVQSRRAEGPRTGVVSHASACEVHGLGDPPGGRAGGRVELTVPARRTTRDENVVLHCTEIEADEVTLVEGLPVTTVERTIADLLRSRTDGAYVGAVIADAAAKGMIRADRLAQGTESLASAYGLPPGTSGRRLVEALCEQAGRVLPSEGPETTGAGGANPEKKRATIWEVAQRAGVSHQTVSRYLKNNGGMRPATREKIDRAVAELNYRPNLIARSMRTQKSNRITIVLPELTNFVPIPMLRGASAAAHEAGYMTDVVGLEGGESRRVESVLSLLETQQAEGVLSLVPVAGMADQAQDRRRPVVVLGEYDDDMHARGELANGRPAEQIVRHLAGQGHRRFLHVAGSQDWASARNRRAVYVDAIARLGLESYGVVDGDWSVRSGYDAARDLPADSGVTAVLAANDFVAMGVIRGFEDRGLRVPQDVSVFGWDNEQFTEYFLPTISTVDIDREALGRRAMSSLLGLIRGEPEAVVDVSDLFRIVPRASSGPAPGWTGAVGP